MEMPFITIYARILDRITGKVIVEYDDVENISLNYGEIHQLYGGLSQYIIEFDIWNNEPAISMGWTQKIFSNIKNVELSLWPDEKKIIQEKDIVFRDNIPFMYMRCITNNKHSQWEPIMDNKYIFKNFYGNVNPSHIGELSGIGDHCILQTGINIPLNKNVQLGEINFVILMDYEVDNIKYTKNILR